MANPVADQLVAVPPAPSWQDNAPTTDTNEPQDTDFVKSSTATGLSPNLRSIKSNVRQFSLDAGWANFTGLTSAPSPLPATYDISSSGSRFSLAGDWVTPGIAVIGRVVRATFTDGTKAVATITNVNTAGGITAVTVSPAILAAGTLKWVEFSALGSALSGGLNAFALNLILQTISGNPAFVVPVSQGGTSRADQVFGGDLQFDAGAADPSSPIPGKVVAIQGQPWDSSTPIAGTVPQWDGSKWATTSAPVFNPAFPGGVTFNLGSVAFMIQWATGTATSVSGNETKSLSIPLLSAFPNGGIIALAILGDNFSLQSDTGVSFQSFPDSQTVNFFVLCNLPGDYVVNAVVLGY